MGNTTARKYHPLTGALIVPIGYLPSGRAVWPILGGDDTVPTADEKAVADKAAADQKVADAQAAAAAEKAAADKAAAAADDGKGGKGAVLADLAKERDARQAAEQARTEAEKQRQEMLDGIAKALGLKPDETPPDPAELQKTLGDREGRIGALEADNQELSKELAAWRIAAQQGVNAASLMDRRSFLSEVKKLDPSADDFVTKITAAVKTAVDQDPSLRGTASPGHAGIGAVGSADADAAATPGLGRLRQAYATK